MMRNEPTDPRSVTPEPTVVMRDDQPELTDERREELLRNRTATLQAMVITLGVVLAPFIALMFNVDFALGVLAVALAFTTVLTFNGARRNPTQRSRLYSSAILNGVLTIAIVIVLAMRLAFG